MFLTNDGDLANHMLRSHRLPQVYHLKLKTLLTFAEIESLSRSARARISRLKGKEMPWYEVTLSEASRDVLRNKLFQTGHPVEKIRRVAIANLHLGPLAPGKFREVNPAEIAMLSRILEGKPEALAKLPPKREFKPRQRSAKKSRGPRDSSSRRDSQKDRTFSNRSKRSRKTKFTA